MNAKITNWLCFLVLAFLGLYIAAFQRILNVMAHDFSLVKVATGIIIAVHFTGAFFAPLIAGELSDKYGRKIIITGSFIVFLIGLLTIFLSDNLMLLLVGVFFVGSGFSVLESSITTLLTDIAPNNSNRIIGLSQIFFGIGAAIGPFLAAVFLINLKSWKYFYVIFIVLIVVFAFIFFKYPYPDNKPGKELEGIISLTLLKNKLFQRLLISIIIYVGIEEGIAFWITSYMKVLTESIYSQSIALSAFWSSMIIGRYIISKFSEKLNEIIIVSSFVSVIFLIIALNTDSLAVNAIAFFGLGFGLSGVWPIIMSLVKTSFTKVSGTAFGIMMAGCALGGAIIPFIMGVIAQVGNLNLALAFCILPFSIIAANHISMIRCRISDINRIH